MKRATSPAYLPRTKFLLAFALAAFWLALPVLGHTAGAGNVNEARVLEEAARGHNWLLKGGDFTGQHYSPLAEINQRNINQLGLAWSADLPIPDGISTTPIVVDGVIYLSGAYSVVLAIDASNGRILWSYDPGVRQAFAELPMLSWPARVNRGVAVWAKRVYLSTADCRLIALDAGKGTALWSKQTCDNAKGFFITDSPYVGGGKVFLGNAGSESQENGRGYVSAYDTESGDLKWRFFIVPSDNPEENDTAAMKMAAKTWSGDALEKYGGGGHNWNEMTYDPASNQLFFGTSGAYPYVHAERSPVGGENLFLSSVVAVDADTGEYQWHYQTVDKDSWDYNATMNIVLADMQIRGRKRETLLIAPKNGFHYTLDRHNGELLAVGKFAKTNWASDIDIETGKPVYDPAGEYWTLEDGETAYLWPNMWGAHNWHPMAYHPGTNLSYIPVVDAPARVSGGEENEAIVMLDEVDGKPHAPGKLVAMDPATGKIRWRIDHERPFNGGLMTTAGNLLFQGLATGEFQAYAANTGERLWSVQTGSAINASPATYSQAGTQYVLIPIGAGGGLQFLYPEMHSTSTSRGPTRLLAFALEGKQPMPVTPIPQRRLPDQPKFEASPDSIAAGAALYSGHCKICHGSNAIARFDGSVPDLRYATSATLDAWDIIVVGGVKASNGMPAMGISAEESQAIRSYVLSLATELGGAP
ncbi:MAG: PQQ-dependent dehydrogenase, methanol/ethanol family [Pseudomonadales bacterium]|nr:PQQ-dependent dehydrogenase, methanol/ethanol family [Pseudomonadales bacterium]MDP6472396.1 PQQ-dependent dehydrogenase, methanol/ethanol family [Pseudomonadales bacterium]MDP6828192.1 PQQ-dependent dehydrogenase, methanol/ethanol family [Pseudomonadales bacterium]MDP6971691.1 PQQ-dependent dehydrogenase, methanol/ethanol family [Pseudomonadales bacterium]